MVRKIVTVIVIVSVLLVAGLLIFIKTVDLNQYLPQLTQQISLALGRQAGVQKIGLNISMKQGVVIDIGGITLSDDPLFSREPFLFIQHIHGGVNLLPLLTKRQIEITSIEIRSPQIVMIKNNQGAFNYESMLAKQKHQETSTITTASESASSSPEKELPKLLVNSFAIVDAKIVYRDLEASPPMAISIEDLDAKVLNFSLTEPFTISLDAALFANGQNIHLDGTSRIDLSLQQARLDDVHFTFNLSLLNVEQINKEITAVTPLGLQNGLSGTVQAVISQMVIGSKGLLVLSLDGNIAEVRAPLKILAVPIDHLTAKLDVTESRIKMSDFSFKLNTGQVSGHASIKDYLTSQDFDVSMILDGLILEDILEQSKAPVKIKGNMAGVISMVGHGFSSDALKQISGKSEVNLKDAELVNVNIIKSILEKIPVLSSFSQVAESKLSQDFQNKIAGDSTKISHAVIKTRIEQASIFVDDFQLMAEKFTLASHGQVGFDQVVDLQAELKFTKEMSEELIESAKDMEALADENREIHFPVNISGQLPSLNYVPDIAYISKLLIVNKGGGELQKVLEKNPEAKRILDIFTGGEKDPNQGQENVQPGGESSGQTDEQPTQGQKLLKGLLQGVLK